MPLASPVRPRRAAAVLALLLPLGTGLAPASADAASWPSSSASAAPRGLTAYLLTADAVVPVDLRTRTLGTPIPTPAPVDDMVIGPDGRTGYVLLQGVLRPVDLVTGTLYPGTSIGRSAADVALTPDGRRAVVTDRGARDVTFVDLATGRATAVLEPGGGDPNDTLGAVAITPDGATAYVTASCSGAVYPVDLATRSVRRAIVPPAAGNYPCPDDVAVAPDGVSAYIADAFSTAGLSPFDVRTEQLRPPIDISAASAGGIVVTPDSGTVFVGTDSALAVVDVATQQVDLLRDADLDRGYAVHPSGRTLLVPLSTGGVVPLDTRTYARSPSFATGLTVRRVVVAPDQAPAAGFDVTPGAGTRGRHFDAGTSVGVTSAITSYRWRFGDGTSRTTTTPVVDHTYARAGRFQVRLTVTDANGTSTSQVFASTMLLRNGLPRATTTRSVTIA